MQPRTLDIGKTYPELVLAATYFRRTKRRLVLLRSALALLGLVWLSLLLHEATCELAMCPGGVFYACMFYLSHLGLDVIESRRYWRALLHRRCTQCDYPMRGLADGDRCPECGMVYREHAIQECLCRVLNVKAPEA